MSISIYKDLPEIERRRNGLLHRMSAKQLRQAKALIRLE